MISAEEFRAYMDDILAELPEAFFRELNGGVLLSEAKKIHPESRNNDLHIMGEYRRERGLGKYIVIYYGSYESVYGHLPADRIKDRLRKTILHEFRHHLEYLAGEKDLEIEDARSIARYKGGLYNKK